ncbi:MAG: hypothetical protein U9P44_03965, partial [archaeon]|nr:hypothetical protein [archaeon]
FLSHLDDSYVLYGIPQTDSPVNTGYIDYTENPVQIDANPSTGDPISWNSTVSVSPRSTVPALYSGGLWQSTQGVVWYQNVTAPSGGKINIKFLAALAGEYYPDPAAYDLSAQVSVSSPSFTQMSVNIERTEIIPSSPSSEQYNQSTTFLFSASVSQDDFIYDIKDNRSILFAIPYSPNGNILSSYSKTISLTFKTDEVTIETLSVKGKSVGTGLPENEITVIFDLVNPTNLTISNLAIKYPIPSLTSSCSVSGSYSGSCVSSSGFALQNISQVLPGRTQYTLNYITDANMTNTNEIYYDYLPTPRTDKSVFNWGDNVTLKSDIKSSSSFDAEIFTEVILLKNTGNLSQTPVSENSIVWSDRTTATLNSSGNIIKPVWQIPVNTSTSQPGEYLLKIYALENATSKYLLKNIVYVNLTDELNLTITATDISSETADGIPEGNFNFSFSGSVKKQTGASLNGTIIGPSVYVYLNAVEVSGSPWSVTSGGQLQNIVVKNIDPGIGSHTFKIEVLDEFNNSGIYLYHFNVTNTVESITVLVNNSDTFTANEEDWVKISGIIYGNGSKKVYDADVTVNAGIETICTTKSDMAGAYSCDWQVPYGKDVSAYTISVEAISPLNTTKTVTNSTSLKVVWLDVTIDPQISDIGVTSSSGFSKSVTAEGDVRYSRDMTNISLVENAAVTCFIKDTKGWNNSHDVLVSAAGNYTCIFSSGLNHTGNYFVKISAEHNIENITEPVRGYKEQSFKIIDTSDDSSGSSPSSTTVPAVYVPQTTTTEATDSFNFNYNDTIEIEQGSDKIISIIVTNIGDGTLNNVSISLSGLSSISWNVITSQPITVFEPNVSAVFNINISVPYDAQVSDYNVSATVTAQQDIDESIEFQLLILPSVKSVEDMQKYFNDTEDIISGYNDRLDYLFVEFSDQNILQKLLKPLNSTKIADVKFKIHEAKKLLKESMGLFEAGNNIEAFKTKHQADNLIQEIEAMLKEEELKMSQWLKLRNIFIIMGLFMLALLLFTGYMLLPPIKTKYAPKDEFFQQKIKKPFLASLSLKLKNITGRVSSNKDGKMSGQKKYDVSGKDKIDTLNEEFKKHLKDED